MSGFDGIQSAVQFHDDLGNECTHAIMQIVSVNRMEMTLLRDTITILYTIITVEGQSSCFIILRLSHTAV